MPKGKKRTANEKKKNSRWNFRNCAEQKPKRSNVRRQPAVAVGGKEVKRKKLKRKLYTSEALKNAIQAYSASQSSLRVVARTYGVPPATLARKVKDPSTQGKRSGPSTVLDATEEEDIVQWIFDRAKMGLPVTKDDLIDAVGTYVSSTNKPNPFIANRPGRHWYEGFKRRHPDLTIRTPQHLSHKRADVTQEDLQDWFEEQKNYLSSKNLLDISPTRVFNCDETNVALCPKSNKILTKKGSLTAYKITDDVKIGITVLFMYSASGKRAPPMILFPYKEKLPRSIIAKIPTGWGVGISDNGWMTLELFYEYMTNVFYPWLLQEEIEFPVVLYLDNHSSHLTMPLVKFCREKKIEIIGLYPNSTHIMQPLDIAFFHPFKEAWKKTVTRWKTEKNMKELKKEDVGTVLKQTLESMQEEDIIKNGFRATGLVPFNPNAVDYDILNKKKEKSKQPVSASHGESIDLHLQKFQDYLNEASPDLLHRFEKDLPTGSWTGNLENKALFEYWYWLKSSKTG